eukprot:TRINITY_DN238_c0_g1_i1.p1 TRINITY_DN238_c0_g1~~TRINITY_DN238_c0_g1_i1.p1  ORF type:complete len:1148 (+),score=348.90 TRINITY_DN238_c0_g1_i1:62-3505(+)
MSLVETHLNASEILAEVDGDKLQELVKNVKSEVEVFYSPEHSVFAAVEKLNNKEEEKERTMKVLYAVSLDGKSNEELTEMLLHREEMMRERAINILHDRLIAIIRENPGSNEYREMLDSFQNNPKSLFVALKTKKFKTLEKAVGIIKNVMQDTDKLESIVREIKQNGEMKNLTKLLSLPYTHPTNDELVIDILYVIATLLPGNEALCDEFRNCNGIVRLIPYLSHKNTSVVHLCTFILQHVSRYVRNHSTIVKSGAIRQIIENAINLTTIIKQESFLTLSVLSITEHAHDYMTLEDFRHVINELDPTKCYQKQGIDKDNLIIQSSALEILHRMSATERIQKILCQLNIIQVMLTFFRPMKANSGSVWNFDILLIVLKILRNLVNSDQARTSLIEVKGLSLIVEITKNPKNYPEDCILEAANILTTCANKVTNNQAAYGKLALLQLNSLCPLFPTNTTFQDLLAQVVIILAKLGQFDLIIKETQAHLVVLQLIRENRVKPILINACAALAHLIQEASIVQQIARSDIVVHLILLLQFNQPEMQLNIVRCLAAVAEGTEQAGIIEIVRSGGISPLVGLMSDKNTEVQHYALCCLIKILSPKFKDTVFIYTEQFFEAEGEIGLVECLHSTEEKVLFTALCLLQQISELNIESREILRDAKVEEALQKASTCPTVLNGPKEVLKIIEHTKNNMRKDSSFIAGMAASDNLSTTWVNVVYDKRIKTIPIYDTITLNEFHQMIALEFGLDMFDWDRITVKLGNEEVNIADQRTLMCMISYLPKIKNLPFKEQDKFFRVEVQPKAPNYPGATNDNPSSNKFDELLKMLTHQQLRILLKEVIDQQAEMTGPIRQYITIEKKRSDALHGSQPERVSTVYGKDSLGKGPQKSSQGLVADGPKGPPAQINHNAPKPPPPPPPMKTPTPKKPAAATDTKKKPQESGDFMTQLKKVIRAGGNLRRVEIDDHDSSKRGDFRGRKKEIKKKIISEECEIGSSLWRDNTREFLIELQKAYLMDYDIMHIVFLVINRTQLTFENALAIFKRPETIDHEILAQAMLACGFVVKFQYYKLEGSDDDEEKKEYTVIVCPYDLPVHIHLKAMSSIINNNGKNRRGDPMTDTVDKLRILQKQKQEQEEQEDVVQGFWKKKEIRVVGSLWN